MAEIKQKLFNGRPIKEEKTFEADGRTFGSWYQATGWLHENGYSYGSSAVNRNGVGPVPVAIQKGQYTLPQKWHNFSKEEKDRCDGVIIPIDTRAGQTKIVIFMDKTIL